MRNNDVIDYVFITLFIITALFNLYALNSALSVVG